MEVQPYVKKSPNEYKFFILNQNHLQLSENQDNAFGFKVYLYNENQTQHLSMHVNHMENAIDNKWTGQFTNSNIFIKINGRERRIAQKKWILDHDKPAFAILCQNNTENSRIPLPSQVDINPWVKKRPKLKLITTFEGTKKDAFDEIDEYMTIQIQGDHCKQSKDVEMGYSDTEKLFFAEFQCSYNSNNYTVSIHSNIFEPVKQNCIIADENVEEFEMKLNKPVLCVVIHPSEQFKVGPINVKQQNFSHFKNRFYDTINYFDSTSPWQTQWSSSYYFIKKYGHPFQRLINTGKSIIKWEQNKVRKEILEKISLEFNQESIPYDKILNEAMDYINQFSISDQLSFKGIVIIVSANPPYTLKNEDLKQLQNMLQKNKIGAAIAQFGLANPDYINHTENNKQNNHLLFIEFNLEKEFNDWYFAKAFKKIRYELRQFMNNNGFHVEALKE